MRVQESIHDVSPPVFCSSLNREKNKNYKQPKRSFLPLFRAVLSALLPFSLPFCAAQAAQGTLLDDHFFAGQEAFLTTKSVEQTSINSSNTNIELPNVFGGGFAAFGGTSIVENSASIHIHEGQFEAVVGGGYAFGGSELAKGTTGVGQTNLSFSGGEFNEVYGGGVANGAGSYSGVGSSKISISGGSFKSLYGGSQSYGSSPNYLLAAGQSSLSAATSEHGQVQIFITAGKLDRIVAGSYAMGGIAGVASTNLTISGGTIETIYAGGHAFGQNGKSTVTGSSSVEVTGGEIKHLFGGGLSQSGTTSVNKSIISISAGTVGTVFGGGHAINDLAAGGNAVKNGAQINVSGGSIGTIVLGGLHTTFGDPEVNGESSIKISGNATSISGDIYLTGIKINKLPEGYQVKSTVGLNGSTSVTFQNQIDFNGNIFGSAESSDKKSRLFLDYSGQFNGNFTNISELHITKGNTVSFAHGISDYYNSQSQLTNPKTITSQFGSLDTLTITGGGTVELNGSLELRKGKTLIVENASLKTSKANLTSGSLHITANWEENGASSLVSIGSLEGNQIGAQIHIGSNAALTIGDLDTTAVELLNQVGREHSSSDIKSMVYIAGPVTLTKDAFIYIGDQNESAQSAENKGILVKSGSALIVNAEHGKITINGLNDHDFSTEENSLIVVDNAAVGKDVLVAENFSTLSVHETTQYLATNRLLTLEKKSRDENGELVFEVKAPAANTGPTDPDPAEPSPEDPKPDQPESGKPAAAELILKEVLIPNTVLAASADAQGVGSDRLRHVLNRFNGLSDKEVVKTINSMALLSAGSGAQTMALTTSDWILDSLNLHGSKLAAYDHEKSGADLWIDLDGIFSKANGYRAAHEKFGYKSDLTGVTLGADYAFGNGAAIGAAASLGKGSVRGQNAGSGIKNKIDFYGIHAYGVWSTSFANFIGTAGYLHSRNEIQQYGYKGKPNAETFVFGLRAEKSFELNSSLTVTPHIGVRYTHIKLDSFKTGGFSYRSENINLVSVPFGAAFSASIRAACGANIKPFLDLTVAPNFGERKAANKVGLEETGYLDSFDARIANNAMLKGKIGLEASKGSHSFGLNFGVNGGNKGRADQTLEAKYRYQF